MSDDVFDSEEAAAEFTALMQDPAARQAFVELKAKQEQSGAKLRYEHILRAVGETPWAIRPAMLGVIVDLLAFRAEGGRLSQAEVAERIAGARRAPQAPPQGVAVIPLHGVMVPKAGMMEQVSGATSMESFRQSFRQTMAASDVSAVVLDVDSPGGMVDQVPEMAAEIRAARGQKPIVAIANSEAASAAYWLASQADSLVVTKSGRVGSIGVFTAHENEAAKNEAAGIQTTLVSAGKFKTEGNPFEPLSPDARAHMQSMVDNYYGMFVSDVAKGRGVPVSSVRAGFGEGRVVGAEAAVNQGMADGVGTFDDVVGPLLRKATAPAAMTAVGFESNVTTSTSSSANWPPKPVALAGDIVPEEVAVEELALKPRHLGPTNTAAQLRDHLAANPPDGHGEANMRGLEQADLKARHDKMHSGGNAPHTHAVDEGPEPEATDGSTAPTADDDLLSLKAKLSALQG